MTEHTKTPWKYSPNSFGTQFIYGDLETPKQTPMGVSYFHLVAGGDHPATLTEANAAFIVKAVNNHERFERALRKIADQMLTHELELESEGDFEGAYDILIGIAREALRVSVGSGKVP